MRSQPCFKKPNGELEQEWPEELCWQNIEWTLNEIKTAAVEPANPFPSLLTISHSVIHWTTTTFAAFLTWLDTTVMNSDGIRATWICFMDVSTVHVSWEFVTLHVQTHAHIRLVFVPPKQYSRVPAA